LVQDRASRQHRTIGPVLFKKESPTGDIDRPALDVDLSGIGEGDVVDGAYAGSGTLAQQAAVNAGTLVPTFSPVRSAGVSAGIAGKAGTTAAIPANL
jgi:hypothetical protein